MVKKFVLSLGILLSFFVTAALSADYYVSSSSGNDLNAGTAWNAPWKTLSKAQTTVTTAGNTVYLRQGDTWWETLTAGGSGTAGSPIIYTVTAGWNPDGAKPIVTARQLIAGATVESGTWVDLGNNIWRMGVQNMSGTDMRRLWITSATNSVTFEPKRAQTATAPNSNTLWGMDTSNKRLYLYATSNPATLYNRFMAAGYANSLAINTAGRDYVEIRNIEAHGGYTATVQCYGDFCVFDNLTILYSGLKGFLVHGVGQDGGNAYGGVISNCIIDARDTRKDGYEVVAPDDGIRLNAGAWNWDVYGNKIYNYGHTGVYLTDGQGLAGYVEKTMHNQVHGNIVDCSSIDYGRGFGTDGGWQQNGDPTATAAGCLENYIYNNTFKGIPARNQINGTTNYVFNNVIDGVFGVSWRSDDTAQGVTFEGYSNGVSYGNVFANNLVMNCTSVAAQFGVGSGSGEVSGNIVSNNIFYNTGKNPRDPNVAGKAIWSATFASIGKNVFQNNAIYTGSDTPIYYKNDGAISVSAFNTKTSDAISGNIQAPPLLVQDGYPALSYGSGDYHLQIGSSLINAGTASAVINPVTWALSWRDFDEVLKPQLGYFDIGPYEFIGSATMYVSETGSDANSGISSASPWLSIDKINNATFNPGNYVLLERGGEWREKLQPSLASNSGSATQNIYFQDYGTGDLPILNGSDLATDWAPTGLSSVVPDTFNGTLDTGNTSQFTAVTQTNGTVAASALASYSGGYGARITFAGSGANAYAYRSFTAVPTVYMRMYVRFGDKLSWNAADTKKFNLMAPRNGTEELLRVGVRYTGGEYTWYSQFVTGSFAAIYDLGTEGYKPKFDGQTWYKIELWYTGNYNSTSEAAQLIIWEGNKVVVDSGIKAGEAITTHTVSRAYFGGMSGDGLYPGADGIIDVDGCAVDADQWCGEAKSAAIYYAAVTWDANQLFESGARIAEATFDTDIATSQKYMMPGTWVLDQDLNRLYAWATTSVDPDTLDMEISRRDTGFYGRTGSGINYVTLKNLHATKANSIAGFYTGAGSHVTIQDCTASHNWMRGIHTAGSDMLVEGCEVYDNYYGIRVDGDDITIRNNRVCDNIFWENGDGIHVEGASGDSATRINLESNDIYDNNYGDSADNIQIAGYVDGVTARWNKLHGARGLIVTNSSANVKAYFNVFYSDGYRAKFGLCSALVGGKVEFYNNTLYLDNVADGGIKITSAHADGLYVRNNIVYATDTVCLYRTAAADVANVTLSNNLYYTGGSVLIAWDAVNYATGEFSTYQTNTGKDSDSFMGDPLFVDAANQDFQVLRDSPTINTGYNLGFTDLPDFYGRYVPVTTLSDIGASESLYVNNPTTEEPQQTTVENTTINMKRVSFYWISDAAGNYTGVSVGKFSGKVLGFTSIPSIYLIPHDGFDVQILSVNGYDILDGRGADLPLTEYSNYDETQLGFFMSGPLTIKVTNAGPERAGILYLYTQ